MPALSDLVGAAITGYARSGAAAGSRASVSTTAMAISCAVIAAACATASIAAAVVALWAFVLPRVGPAGAALLVAAVLAILSIALTAIAFGILRRPRRASPSGIAPELAIAEARRLFKEHKGAAVLAALVGGLMIGNHRPAR